MNKKVKALIGSALAIAMSASVATGATFALFTDKAEVNVAITAGRVDVDAQVSGGLKLYTIMDGVYEYMGDGVLDFAMGGYATLEGNKISLVNIIPGDKVEFDIALTNNSNVKTKVRTVISDVGEDKTLLNGLNVYVNGVKANLVDGAIESAWENLEPNATIGNGVMKVSIELPYEAGNEYIDKVAELRFLVEAVQGNAQVESNSTEKKLVINSKSDFINFADSVNAGNAYSGWNVYLNTNIDLDGAEWAPINGFRGKFNGQGYTVADFVVNVEGNFAGLFGKAYSTIKSLNVTDVYHRTALGWRYRRIQLR